MASPGVPESRRHGAASALVLRSEKMILCYFLSPFFFLAIYKQLINMKFNTYFDLWVFSFNFRLQWSTIDSPQNSTDLQDTLDLLLCLHPQPPSFHPSGEKKKDLVAKCFRNAFWGRGETPYIWCRQYPGEAEGPFVTSQEADHPNK